MFLSTFFVFVAIQSNVSFDKDVTKTFQWLDTLDYQQKLDRQFVRVLSSYSEDKPRTIGCGFLLGENEKSFSVLLTNLGEAQYAKVAGKDSYQTYSYAKEDFPAFARSIVAAHRQKDSYGDGLESGAFEPFAGFMTSTSFAWICHRKGMDREAAEIVKADQKWVEINKKDFFEFAQDFIPAGAVGHLVTLFENPDFSLKDIRARFKTFTQTFHDIPVSKHYEGIVANLDRMIVEEQAHANRPKNPNPTESEQIADLIWELRNEGGGLSINRKTSSAEALEKIGMRAVPQLLDAIKDNTYTRGLIHPMSGPPSTPSEWHIYRVGQLAIGILERISSKHFSFDQPTGEKEARAWYASVGNKGEMQTLIDGVLKADYNSARQAELLVQKYPKQALAPIMKAYPKISEEIYRGEMVKCLKSLPYKDIQAFLGDVIRTEKKSEPRVQAAMVITNFDPKAGIAAMINEWKRSVSSNGFQFSDHSIVSFLIESGSPVAYAAILKDISAHPPTLRHNVIMDLSRRRDGYPMYFPKEASSTSAKENEECDRIAEDILAVELADKDEWGGSTGIGSLSFDGPLFEMATYALAQRFPGIYRFSKSNSMSEREKQRIASLNVYRARRGIGRPIPNNEWEPKPIKEGKIAPLIDRVAATDDGSAKSSILSLGLSSYPFLSSSVAKSQEGTPARARLEAILLQVGNILRKIEVENPKNGPESSVAAEVRAFEGHSLTSEDFFKLVAQFASRIEKKQMRAVHLLGVRDSNGSGIVITVQFLDRVVQGGASVSVGGNGSYGSGGGDATSFTKYLDEDLKIKVHKAFAAPPTKAFEISFTIAIPTE